MLFFERFYKLELECQTIFKIITNSTSKEINLFKHKFIIYNSGLTFLRHLIELERLVDQSDFDKASKETKLKLILKVETLESNFEKLSFEINQVICEK